MDALRGSSPSKNPASSDSPEQLLNSFKAAALSVTKLYKTSVAAQAKARSDGYQDCIDDLLAFLDKRNIGLSDGEGWLIRRWATERLDGKDAVSQGMESEDEVDKNERASSPELHRSNSGSQLPPMRNDSAPPACHQSSVSPIAEAPPMITVPTQETFTFQSSHSYPQDSYMNLENLDLSDATKSNDSTSHSSSAVPISHPPRSRNNNKRGTRPRPTNLQSGHLGKGAGQKRPINFAELFDVGSLGFGKDVFGREGKRTRHT